uniref:Uncharacterized protein n=1 Tax=Romanomermis culicivorax TaxID=13658 RepID=A0A915K5C5_ROMCU
MSGYCILLYRFLLLSETLSLRFEFVVYINLSRALPFLSFVFSVLRLIYTCIFRWNGTDRQQLETFSLKIDFRLERISAILRKTTDGYLELNDVKISLLFGYVPPVAFRSVGKGKRNKWFDMFDIIQEAEQTSDCFSKKIVIKLAG